MLISRLQPSETEPFRTSICIFTCYSNKFWTRSLTESKIKPPTSCLYLSLFSTSWLLVLKVWTNLAQANPSSKTQKSSPHSSKNIGLIPSLQPCWVMVTLFFMGGEPSHGQKPINSVQALFMRDGRAFFFFLRESKPLWLTLFLSFAYAYCHVTETIIQLSTKTQCHQLHGYMSSSLLNILASHWQSGNSLVSSTHNTGQISNASSYRQFSSVPE